MDESAALTTDLEYPRSINFEARKERVPRDVATDVDPLFCSDHFSKCHRLPGMVGGGKILGKCIGICLFV